MGRCRNQNDQTNESDQQTVESVPTSCHYFFFSRWVSLLFVRIARFGVIFVVSRISEFALEFEAEQLS